MRASAQLAIGRLEKAVKARVKLRPVFKPLLTVSGIGEILELTIMLETGEIGRFAKVGNYASYCRCVGSQHFSNGKRKGRFFQTVHNKLHWAIITGKTTAEIVQERADTGRTNLRLTNWGGAKTAKDLQTEIARLEPWPVVARSQGKTEEFFKFEAEVFYKSYS